LIITRKIKWNSPQLRRVPKGLFMSILKKIIKPYNCTIAFGIPISCDEWCDERKNSIKGDRFAKSRFTKKFFIPNQYKQQVVEPYNKTIGLVPKELELKVITGLTLDKYTQAISSEQRMVFILFSHWDGENIEFFDEFYNSEKLAQQIPNKKIIDICACRPENLAQAIKKTRSDCFVQRSDQELIPAYWLHYYVTFFRYLRDEELTYLLAVEKTVEFMLRASKS